MLYDQHIRTTNISYRDKQEIYCNNTSNFQVNNHYLFNYFQVNIRYFCLVNTQVLPSFHCLHHQKIVKDLIFNKSSLNKKEFSQHDFAHKRFI